MNFLETNVRGVLILVPIRHGDHRGFFAETYSQLAYAEHGVDAVFVQDNHSLIRGVGTVRGLHFQAPPHAQAKLVRCGRGAIFDVAVDIRRGSPTYGRWAGYSLAQRTARSCYIPAGFAHGFATLSPTARLSTNVAIITRQKPRARCVGMTRKLASSGPSAAQPVLSEKDAAPRCWPALTAHSPLRDKR